MGNLVMGGWSEAMGRDDERNGGYERKVHKNGGGEIMMSQVQGRQTDKIFWEMTIRSSSVGSGQTRSVDQ